MNAIKICTVKDIEELTESEAQAMASEHIDVKGHDVYLVDFDNGFGYSALVFAEGRHIKYANDYELHHPKKTREELRSWYEQALNAKLFTEDELRQTSEDYGELKRKRGYLSNYYGDRREHQSMFCYGEPAEWYKQERAEGTAVFSHVSLAWYHGHDRDFVSHMAELKDALEEANDPLRDYQHAKAAFKEEMFNHEYAINWQGDWDVINCFAKVEFDDGGQGVHRGELAQAPWSDEIKQAYRDAAREVMGAYENNPY